MATYKLIPSSLTGNDTITNPSNAYTDTDSDTSANVNSSSTCYLGGFDFSVIPSDVAIKSIQVKVKAMHRFTLDYTTAVLVSSGASDANVLSDTVAFPPPSGSGGYVAYVRTFTISATVGEIMQYADTICIRLDTTMGMYIYGAEVIVETIQPVPNKIIYGSETLIDLTSDTATESDVASGKTFHLASGAIGTGTFSASMNEKFMTTRTTTTLSVTDLEKRPDWFVVVPTVDNAGTTNMLVFFLYDGTNTYTASSGSGNIRINQSPGMRWSMSFSNGTLTLTKGASSSSPDVSTASKYKIYYL